jgi:metallophosphoesterase superfamily enzyme
MRMEFIEEGPALIVEETMRVLVIADLHLGIESDLARHGLHFMSRSADRQERAVASIRREHPDLVLLLGDVKHNVPITSRQEYWELPSILASFRQEASLQVIPGNHDSGIERFLKPGELLPKDGTIIDGTGYLHGHTSPSPALREHLIIAGHHHPYVSLRDEVGCSLRSSAYLLAGISGGCLWPGSTEGARALFVPAFNEFSGYDIRRIVDDPFSPLSRCIAPGSAEVILPDGTYLGPLDLLEPGDRDDD